MNSELRRYLPFFATVLAVVALAVLSFGAGYRLGVASHRVTHAGPAARVR